jgi:hypothetical protein
MTHRVSHILHGILIRRDNAVLQRIMMRFGLRTANGSQGLNQMKLMIQAKLSKYRGDRILALWVGTESCEHA